MREIRVPDTHRDYNETIIPARDVKFYQVGSFAVGNRLVPEELRSNQSDPKRQN